MTEIINDWNIFELPSPFKTEACLVTTNGMVRKDGKAVMGAGIAKYVRDTFSGVDKMLGDKLIAGGNHVYDLGLHSLRTTHLSTFRLFSFPTKDDWKDNSKPELIRQSCQEIMEQIDRYGLDAVYMPCPGCANGHLDYWRDVRPILFEELDDRFQVSVPSCIMMKRPKGD